jgi:hypothetical protein
MFEPKNLSGEGANYYKKGSWHIPSIEELELLIWYRIRSTATSTTSSTESYWDSEEYSKGNSIFSDKSAYFDSFLNGDMIASNVSSSNKNFVYGEVIYQSGTSVTKYGWFCNYDGNSWYSSEYHEDCKRDAKYSIAPCCNITVTKQS